MSREYEITIKNPKDDQDQRLIADGAIDLVESLEHSFSSRFTDVPLESGASIVDNCVEKPKRIRLSIVVSNQHTQTVEAQGGFDFTQMIATGTAGSSPKDVIDAANDLLSKRERKLLENSLAYDDGSQGFAELNKQISDAVIKSLRGQIGSFDPSQEIPKGRPRATLEALLKIKRRKQLVSVTSILCTHENMVIEKIRTTENLANGSALIAVVEMRQIKFATKVTTTTEPRAVKQEKVEPPPDGSLMTVEEVRSLEETAPAMNSVTAEFGNASVNTVYRVEATGL